MCNKVFLRYGMRAEYHINIVLFLDKLFKMINIGRITYQEAGCKVYYLEKYIRHFEYMQSQEYIKDQSLLESYTGSYDTRGILDSTGYHTDTNPINIFRIFKEVENFYVEDNMGCIYTILPLSQNEFMNTSKYKYTYSFRLEDNEELIMSRKDKRSDRVFYYSRINEPDSARL